MGILSCAGRQAQLGGWYTALLLGLLLDVPLLGGIMMDKCCYSCDNVAGASQLEAIMAISALVFSVWFWLYRETAYCR